MALVPWREAAVPQQEVWAGTYEEARFAADMGQVLAGRADAEYQDGGQFYARTYLTEGMRRLIAQVTARVEGTGGEPVVQLKTSFGGGKTHSLLALYHLFSGADVRSWRGIPELLAELGRVEVPTAKVAVLVGTDLDATIRREDATHHGVEVGTLWGELAAQLGGAGGYAMVVDADRAGAAPGASTLADLLDRFGPAVILVDELVAYVRNLAAPSRPLPAGTFDANLTFIQNLTEAARKSRRSVLLASIPESRIELGSEHGREALARIELIFGRMEAVWQPVREVEAFEIVRRRLFADHIDEKARDATCRAFARLYAEGGADFPPEASQGAYFERLRDAFPIHPEIFDRLYRDWSAIEAFQRTRGVLRLMAGVIHELWVAQDRSPMILPGTLPLARTGVRNELTKYVGVEWNSVVDADVDGDGSAAAQLDRANPRFGQVAAAERLSRTVFLGTAPHTKAGGARGMEESRVRLGAMLPGESVSTFNDALVQLQARATYLYAGNGRYWFGPNPNIQQTMRERAARFDRDAVVLPEIVRRLGALARDRGDFAAVHAAPASADLPDEARARLVLLAPSASHAPKATNGAAVTAARELLEQRGSAPRLLKNTLVFMAPDRDLEEGLEQETRRYLAWRSIVEDKDILNLDQTGLRQASETRDTANATVDSRLAESYAWLLVPRQEPTGPIEFDITRLPGRDRPAVRASSALRQTDGLITRWSPQHLKLTLDRFIWPDRAAQPVLHYLVRALWTALASYPYLPRLLDQRVLEEAIREGVRSRDYFGYATGIAADGTYTGLAFGEPVSAVYVDDQAVLVKPEVARAQLEAGEAPIVVPEAGHAAVAEPTSDAGTATRTTWDTASTPAASGGPARAGMHRFHGSLELDPLRAGMQASTVASEIIAHLTALLDSKVKVRLDIEASSEAGFPDKTVRDVTENARTLKFRDSGFEEE